MRACVCVFRREVYDQGIKVCILEPGYFKTDILNLDTLINNFKQRHDATPDEIRQPYRANCTRDGCKCHCVLHRVRR